MSVLRPRCYRRGLLSAVASPNIQFCLFVVAKWTRRTNFLANQKDLPLLPTLGFSHLSPALDLRGSLPTLALTSTRYVPCLTNPGPAPLLANLGPARAFTNPGSAQGLPDAVPAFSAPTLDLSLSPDPLPPDTARPALRAGIPPVQLQRRRPSEAAVPG